MRKEQKLEVIESVAAQFEQTPDFYVVDIAGLNAEKTSALRRKCFEKDIQLLVVKNTLLRIAIEKMNYSDAASLTSVLEGPTAVMFTTTPNGPAKLIKEFAKDNQKPVLKGAIVQDCTYVGAEMLDTLVDIKSREELIGDIITLLQSPIKNVISGLTSEAGGKVAGLVKTLAEKE